MLAILPARTVKLTTVNGRRPGRATTAPADPLTSA
jgi:hypothetical protein